MLRKKTEKVAVKIRIYDQFGRFVEEKSVVNIFNIKTNKHFKVSIDKGMGEIKLPFGKYKLVQEYSSEDLKNLIPCYLIVFEVNSLKKNMLYIKNIRVSENENFMGIPKDNNYKVVHKSKIRELAVDLESRGKYIKGYIKHLCNEKCCDNLVIILF